MTTTTTMNHALTPCDCRLSRDAAMACPRTPRGKLYWTPVETSTDAVGSMQVEDLDGNREPFTLGHEWMRASRGLAEGYASVRHLEFVVVSS